MQTVTIPHKLVGINDYTRACRTNKYVGAKMKQEQERICGLYIARLKPMFKPVHITITWVETGKHRDPDNIAFAKKFILDSLVHYGVIGNDNHRHIKGFTDLFEFGDDYAVIVEIKEVHDVG